MSDTATHEKQISKSLPWVLLGVGGLLLFGGVLSLSLAAAWEELTPGFALNLGALAFIGMLLVLVGLPLQKRAEDWENWKEPATYIAETREDVKALKTDLAAVVKEIRRNQNLLLSSLGTPVVPPPPTPHHPSLPSADTLNEVRQYRILRAGGEEPANEAKQTAEPDGPKGGRSFPELLDMAEWYNLGAETERRKHLPPDQQN